MRKSHAKPTLTLISILILSACSSWAQGQYPFQNPDLPIEQRVESIIAWLTFDEKIACLSTNPSVPRLGIRGSDHIEGLHGVMMGGPAGMGGTNPIPTTIFPQAMGLGETWDPETVRRAAAIEGYEARYLFQSPSYRRGGIVVRAPNADLGRDPRWGRTEESYGEDPYFNGVMAVAFVHGLQGDHPTYWQAASLLKHFLANSNEDGRGGSSSDFDERLLREYYSVPFRKGIVDGGARAFMAAYNAVNGIPCTVQPILKDITVQEWGNDGIICTDMGSLGNLVTQHYYYPSADQAAAASVKAGISQFLDNHWANDFYEPAIRQAINQGLVTMPEIERVIKGNFRVMIRLGLLDPPGRVPYSSIGAGPAPWLSEANHQAVREVTQKSIVLLKNENQTLPLDKASIASIAVLGRRANEVLLDWYSGMPPYAVSPLQGIRNAVGAAVSVEYAETNAGGAAVALAAAADVAIVCVGNHPTCDGASWGVCALPCEGREAVDRQEIALDAEQENLIKAVRQANPRTVVVLISSFPYAINWAQENVPAILHMTHSSQELGNALADVLFGDYNPGGRLVQTWPKSLDQLPPMMDYNIRNGRTYMYFTGEPLYPFGYGLSYTTFAYSNLQASGGPLGPGGAAEISVDVMNTGLRAGEEVVQLYVKHEGSAVARPLKELKGFKRVFLAPGEAKTVNLTLKGDDLAYWDTTLGRFVVEPDQVQLMVGSSSADIRLTRAVRVAGEGFSRKTRLSAPPRPGR
jgi:beta-glucosidase